ncbi:exo-alpha-sialidase [Chitinophaga sp. GCM10012297]|uniref:exo-alpha-sialidase n=1 Tax=Chitinophaga chungangae TaxID=2821488 RepID=A0ABS3YJ35_9BACT|nr:sialidase family protein [Chitinophaga chungangae]MBO9154711.1 exo-alpha-sialidase [Chitinophaga chungangae]
MVNIKRIITAALLLCAVFAKGQDAPQRTVLWQANEDTILAHFVYGLAVTDKGTILALAEARISAKDDGAHHIALRRSTDGGNTFSPSKLLLISTNGQCWGNPTIVQDRKTKELFLFYALNHHNDSSQVFFMTSKDDGLTWSGATEITRLFDGSPHGWTFHLPGPGHGIQLKNNRLMVQVWHRRSISFVAAERKYGVNCIYSDDHGKTWKLGGDTPVGEFNESQIVEKKNGDVLMVARTITSQGGSFQARAISKDKGASWSSPIEYDKGLTGTVCDIGLTRYSLKPNILLVSQPAYPNKRRDLTIRLSRDEGKTWPVSKLLQEGSATYSDLAVLPDKSIICLYGHGGGTHMPDTVSLVRFSLQWLMDNSK